MPRKQNKRWSSHNFVGQWQKQHWASNYVLLPFALRMNLHHLLGHHKYESHYGVMYVQCREFYVWVSRHFRVVHVGGKWSDLGKVVVTALKNGTDHLLIVVLLLRFFLRKSLSRISRKYLTSFSGKTDQSTEKNGQKIKAILWFWMTVTYDEELEFQALKRFMAVTNEVHVVIHPITLWF